MKQLWSPWRMEYIQDSKKEEGCVFCNMLLQLDGPGNLILCRGQKVFVIMNRYPYTSGHLLVVPYDHCASLEELNTETRAELMDMTAKALRVLTDVYSPQGYNLGINIGEAAGAGIAEHIHMHIVPRWAGDTNFMSSLASTRVLPEALEDTYWRIRKRWSELT